eukprot:762734-Hanusia_phi.AAC.5
MDRTDLLKLFTTTRRRKDESIPHTYCTVVSHSRMPLRLASQEFQATETSTGAKRSNRNKLAGYTHNVVEKLVLHQVFMGHRHHLALGLD